MKNMVENPGEDFPDVPLEATDDSFEGLVSKYPLVIVDCWAEWCGPCRMIAPVIEELAGELKGKVIFGKLNVDQNMKTASKYGIMAIPTMLVFKNGQIIDQMVGAYPKSTLKNKIERYL